MSSGATRDGMRGTRSGGRVPEEYFELKTRIHDRLLELVDLTILETLDNDIIRKQIGLLVERILREDIVDVPLNSAERKMIVLEIQDEVLGFGPLEPFLQDPNVSDILVNSHKNIYVEKFGKLQKAQARFKDDDHLLKIIDKIVSSVGRRIDESSPTVDARLVDGSRVNAIIPPLAVDGPSLSIRRFSRDPLELRDLIELQSLTPEMGEILKGIVRSRLNIVVCGGTGSGKTTMLNVLSRFISGDERIVTIEDPAELQLKQDHVVRLETRPPNIEGKGEVTQRELVKNCLRMRPDRIILGEVRGGEAFDVLQAMNTGHDGSLTTIHANSPRDALMRIETMVAMANYDIPFAFLRRYIASAIDVIIHVGRLADGSRKMTSLQELVGMEGDMIMAQEIFSFEKTTIGEDSKVHGRFMFHNVLPRFVEKLKIAGVHLPPSLFDRDILLEV